MSANGKRLGRPPIYTPEERGGANDDSNLQLLCQSCNRAKGAKDPVEFMRALGFLL